MFIEASGNSFPGLKRGKRDNSKNKSKFHSQLTIILPGFSLQDFNIIGLLCKHFQEGNKMREKERKYLEVFLRVYSLITRSSNLISAGITPTCAKG